jgi:hypothetical protein
MSKADSYPIPETWLEKEVARLALEKARQLVAGGKTPEDAANMACPGAWREWRGWVLTRLREGQ